MTLQEWIQDLQARTLYIDLSLDRVTAMREALDIQPGRSQIITIAGTNGKGTAANLLHRLLRAQGHTVGTMTSPHLSDFRERLLINDGLSDEDGWVQAFETISATPGSEKLTYFEWVTVGGCWIMQRLNLDFWVLEVGLGGRYDAVNMMDADVAIVTSIAFDHQNYLGNTLESIARNKIDIARPNRPLVIGCDDFPLSEDDIVKQTQARPVLWVHQQCDWSKDQSTLALTTSKGDAYHYNFKLADYFVPQSVLAALVAYHETDANKPLSDAALAVFTGPAIPGRFESITRVGQPEVIFDVAHNPAAWQRLSDLLMTLPSVESTLLVMGCKKDKPAAEMLDILHKQVDSIALFTLEGEDMWSKEDLSKANQAQYSIETIDLPQDVTEAWSNLVNSGQWQRIVIAGSFYTVGAWRPLVTQPEG